MLVLLKANWFAPDGDFYKKDASGTEVPDKLAKFLPSSAKKLNAPVAVAAEAAPSMRDLDLDRASGAAEDGAIDKADAERLANAQRLKDKLAAETKKK